MPVAATFIDETGQSLSEVARLDTMITLIDAAKFFEDFAPSTNSRIARRAWARTARDPDRGDFPGVLRAKGSCGWPRATTI